MSAMKSLLHDKQMGHTCHIGLCRTVATVHTFVNGEHHSTCTTHKDTKDSDLDPKTPAACVVCEQWGTTDGAP